MKHDRQELEGQWSNFPMLLALICIAIGYLLYCLCEPFFGENNA